MQFDGDNVTVDTNCSYVMVRDKIIDNKNKKLTHEFRVVVGNAPCLQNPGKMCPDVVTLTYGKHEIEVTRSLDYKKLDITLDGAEVMHVPLETDWIEIKEKGAKHINVFLPKLQLDMSVYYPTLGVSVKLPSHTYGGKVEGLCGNCNRDKSDDLITPDGNKPSTLEQFTHGWLHGDAHECYVEELKECEEIPKDPCTSLLDPERFGKCHLLLSPAIFLETCRRDICGGRVEQACISLETYAAGCAANGLCVDWHIPSCPPRKCPNPQTYRLCGSACAATCANFDKKRATPCPDIPTEGCFCPEGLVMRNGTCVKPRLCKTCDKEGHHPGDRWEVDSCTSCECDIESTQVRCQTQQCPALETVCEQGYTTLQVDGNEGECCPKYLCGKSFFSISNLTRP